MKSKLFKLSLIILFAGLFTINSNAQPINIGGGLVLATDRPNLGVKVQGTYGMDFLLNNLRSSAGVTIFIPGTSNNIKYSRLDFDFDGQYSFYKASGFDFYAIGGLNITYYHTKWKVSENTITSETKPGLNVGAGAMYSFSDKMKAFSEFKYIMSRYDQAAISLGVFFEL